MILYVTRRETFSASHRLFNPNLSDAENERIFGKCNNPNGHGHNYVVEVTVAGEPDVNTGYVIDLKILKKIIRENAINKLDHKNLNLDVEFLQNKIPTAENIAVGIWDQLKDKVTSGKLYSVKVLETENNYAEYKGEI